MIEQKVEGSRLEYWGSLKDVDANADAEMDVDLVVIIGMGKQWGLYTCGSLWVFGMYQCKKPLSIGLKQNTLLNARILS